MPSIAQELKILEDRYWRAIQHRDAATACDLSANPCIVVGAQGIAEIDRLQLGEMLSQAPYELTRYRLDDKTFHVRKPTDDMAIVAYGVHEDLVVDGKPEHLTAYDASVWIHRGGTWVCALHTESLKGDPYGRRRD
jgi:hypothetical protein